MRRIVSLLLLFVFFAAGALWPHASLAHEKPVVRAVLFYSPTCPHCHKVMQEDLPPLIKKYGNQLQILMIDVTTPGGRELYFAAAESVPIPEDKRGVPALVVGDVLLVGDVEIPAKFPGIIEQGLASGGIDWPQIPGLDRAIQQYMANQGEGAMANGNVNQVEVKAISEMSIAERLALDPIASAIAIITLILMLAMLIWALIYWARTGLQLQPGPHWMNWAIPLLSLIGAGIALYLSYVEATGTRVVCGPVGDCNAVQQSDFARLFGVLPVGVLGLLGYLAILGIWAWQRFGSIEKTHPYGWLLPTIIFLGVAFSAYLTFLEPFIIGAVCMWCITSALIMTALLYLTFRWTIPPRST